MTDTLSKEDLAILQRPFPLNAHTFNKRGFCYVKEAFVTARLEEVDPAWQFEIVGVHRAGAGDQLAVVTARLTLKGSSRSSTGMQAVEYTNTKDAQGNVTGKTETEAGEAEKGATTDALRHCARLFGVGRYILAMGDSVKNPAQLEAWLRTHYPAGAPATTQQSNGNGNAGGNGKPPADAIDLSKPPVWWKPVLDEIVGWKHFDNVKQHATNALNKLIADGTLTHAQARDEVLLILANKYADNAELTRRYEDIPF